MPDEDVIYIASTLIESWTEADETVSMFMSVLLYSGRETKFLAA